MRIVFMGTPEFALPSLRKICASQHRIATVVTAPDRRRGRGQRELPTPVAQEAERAGLPVIKTASLKSAETQRQLRALEVDAAVVVAFGLIVPPALLEWPPHGCVNLHPSLLPKYRGASPIHAPILAGEQETGVTTMLMDEGLDTGAMLMQERVEIPDGANAGDLHDLLAELGAVLLVRTLTSLQAGTLQPVPQDDARASYAPKVDKVEIDWTAAAGEIVRTVHGLSPYPGVHTAWKGKRLKVLRARSVEAGHVGETEKGALPGTFVELASDGPRVAAGEGSVVLREVQPEGRAVMSGLDFVRGFRPELGVRLA